MYFSRDEKVHYYEKYKYNFKNITRYLQEKKELNLLPFNLLYMEAAEEYNVADLLLKLKNVNLVKKIENATAFIEEIDKHKKSIFEFFTSISF